MLYGLSKYCSTDRHGVRHLLLAALIVAAMAASERVVAQESGSNTTTSNSDVLTEVLVTAQKRTETIQSTPIAITALTGEQLVNAGLTNAQGIAQLAPSVAVMTMGPGQAQFTMRGLSPDAGEAPTVGFYLDEVALIPPVGNTVGKVTVDPSLYDIERIEVLRGPQGTLYGSGSMGGTIRVITTPPKLGAFQSSAETIVSGTEDGGVNYAIKGMVNVPFGDYVALRLVASYGYDSGFINRIVVPNFPLPINPPPIPPAPPPYYGLNRGNVLNVPGSTLYKDVNDTEETVARAALLIQPTDRLSITPSVFYQKINQGGINAYDSEPGPVSYAHYEPFDFAEPFSDQFTVASLDINYSWDFATLTSVTADWWRYSSQLQEVTESWVNTIWAPLQGTGQVPSYYVPDGFGLVYGHELDQTQQFTQELRLASRGDGNFKWLLGGYYQKYHQGAPTGGGNQAPDATQGGFPTNNFSAANVQTELTQKAAFGNASYTMGKFTLTAGLRYFSYTENTTTWVQGLAFTGTDAVQYLAPTYAHSTGVLPLLNLSYAASQDFMVYTSASKGYREGAGVIPIPDTGPPGSVGYQCGKDLAQLGLSGSPTQYDPDTVWTYELGEKARLLDGRMTINSAVYYTNWQNVQTFVALECGVGFTTNGPNAAVKGAELEFETKLGTPFTFTQTVGYSHAAFTASLPQANVVEGQRLYDSPLWTLSTTLDYRTPISNKRALFGTITNSYVSSVTEFTAALHTVPGRDITNVRFGLDGGRWSVALFANNLFDVRQPTAYLNLQGLTGPPYDRIAVTAPLTAGVDFNISF